jgi:hypothetical protein
VICGRERLKQPQSPDRILGQEATGRREETFAWGHHGQGLGSTHREGSLQVFPESGFTHIHAIKTMTFDPSQMMMMQ